MSKSGFVYLWFDKKRKKYYLGSHLGPLDDGYTGSNKRFRSAYKNRPESFKRRILESHHNITKNTLLDREQLWLNLIKECELHGKKYYNEKKVAAGGDIISSLPDVKKKIFLNKCSKASKKYWDNISQEEYNLRKINAFGGNKFSRKYLSERNKILCSKKAMIIHPNGTNEEVINIADFCKKYNLNYGNFKTVLRGNRKSCKGFTGKYL
jgi:hypothetical protein